MTIHSEHPFQPPESSRSAIRRLRGRLPSPVTLWTAADEQGRAGLTVSSTMVADGEPGVVLALIDPLSDLWDVLRRTGTAAVSVLSWSHRGLADAFGFVAPAPGGPFATGAWTHTAWGPVPADATAWAGGRLADPAPAPTGWGLLVTLTVQHVELREDRDPLVHRRGRYATF